MREVMIRAFSFLLLLVGLCASAPQARAFTLYGTIPAWFTDNAGQFPGDVYGPMNIGEEYRWNTPAIFYAFDESFLNYFGQRGIEEVEKAIKTMNDLPKMSEVDLGAFPLHSQRVNFRARDLQMLDLKSYCLKTLLEEVGLGTPSRFTYTIRGRNPQPAFTNYLVIMRNFDPVTWAPTPYVNGQLWTYEDIWDQQDAVVKCAVLVEPVDPLILAEPAAALDPGFALTMFGYGSYLTGLTRDDVGGLYYIYRPGNKNYENLPPTALTGDTTTGTGTTTISLGTGDGNAGGWQPIQGTNGVASVPDGKAGEWVPVQAPSTNTATGGTTTSTASGPISGALRGGMDKLVFTRGPAVIANGGYRLAHRYKESITVITNGVSLNVNQQITRILARPDILFTAADLAATDATFAIIARTVAGSNNDTLNGQETLDGPGQLDAPVDVTFSKTGPLLLNTYLGRVGEGNASKAFIWGSFDGSTNDPAVYPVGSTIRDVERAVFGSR